MVRGWAMPDGFVEKYLVRERRDISVYGFSLKIGVHVRGKNQISRAVSKISQNETDSEQS